MLYNCFCFLLFYWRVSTSFDLFICAPLRVFISEPKIHGGSSRLRIRQGREGFRSASHGRLWSSDERETRGRVHVAFPETLRHVRKDASLVGVGDTKLSRTSGVMVEDKTRAVAGLSKLFELLFRSIV